jgi:hypothetical protein
MVRNIAVTHTFMTLALSAAFADDKLMDLGKLEYEGTCTTCRELTTRAYLHAVGVKHVCILCSGYER